MRYILISRWLTRTMAVNLYENCYKKNDRACVLKKTVHSGNYMEYAVARLPWDGEEIPEDHGTELVETAVITIEVLKRKN